MTFFLQVRVKHSDRERFLKITYFNLFKVGGKNKSGGEETKTKWNFIQYTHL